MTIKLKRIYDEYSLEDGFRILVDRLWPRAMPKAKARVDLWLQEVAPSVNLRRWFKHDPRRWPEFQRRYKKELREVPESKQALRALRILIRDYETVTFLYGSSDREDNNAVVLKELLE